MVLRDGVASLWRKLGAQAGAIRLCAASATFHAPATAVVPHLRPLNISRSALQRFGLGGLRGADFVTLCGGRGVGPTTSTILLTTIEGFDLLGTIGSGRLSDRFNN